MHTFPDQHHFPIPLFCKPIKKWDNERDLKRFEHLYCSTGLPPGKTRCWWLWEDFAPSFTVQLSLSCSLCTAWWRTRLWPMSVKSKSWKTQTRNAKTTPSFGLMAPFMKQLKMTQWAVGKRVVNYWCPGV